MGEKRKFRDRELDEDYYWILRQLSSTSFVLAGFSFTSLSLFVGFYRDHLEMASNMISILLICAIIFLVAGEFGREAYKIWEYVLAEILYLLATGLLLMTFLAFVWGLPSIHPVAIFIMIVGVLFFIGKTISDIILTGRTNQ